MESVPKQSFLTRLRLELKRHGLLRTAYGLAVKALNKLLPFRILRGLHLKEVNPAYLECPDGFSCGFLSEAQLRRYAEDHRNELSDDFLDGALAKGDRCYAFLKDGRLAAYSWYSLLPTRIDPADLLLEFEPPQVYLYKGLTLPEFRGLRLYDIGMNRALQCYQRMGRKGLICYVESHNLSSLKACSRLGYQLFGSIFLLQLLGRYTIFNSPGCARFGFRLKEAPMSLEVLGVNEA